MIKRFYTILATITVLIGFVEIVDAQQPQVNRSVKTDRQFLVDDKLNNQKDIFEQFRFSKGGSINVPNLTDEQIAKIKDIRLSEQKQLLQLRNQMGEKRARLRSLETAEKADMKEINKTIDDIAKLHADGMKARAEAKQKIRTLLNDEQRIHFDLFDGTGDRTIRRMRMNRNLLPRIQTQELGSLDTEDGIVFDIYTNEE